MKMFINNRRLQRVSISGAFFILLAFFPYSESIAFPGFGGPENLTELAGKVADGLVENYRERQGAVPEKKPLIIVSKNYFLDPHTEHIYPFSTYLAESLQSALETSGLFDVTNDKDAESRFALGGTYYKEKDGLVVHCRIRTVADGTDSIVTAASATVNMKAEHCGENWFEPSVQSKVRYLMTKIEDNSFNQLYFKKRRDVAVDKFPFGNKDDYPELSDYVVDYLEDFLSGSRLLTPVQKCDDGPASGEKKRDIVPSPVEGASLASFEGATYGITGSYRMVDKNTLEIHASLAAAGDKTILGSSTMRMPMTLINADWIESTVKRDEQFQKDNQGFSPETPEQPFTVNIFTSRGKNGTVFRQGEKIRFAAVVSESAYLRIYERTPKGKIYQLYPNGFSGPERKIRAGESVWIPGQGYPFEFTAKPPFGDEIVKIYASDKPLNDLASIDMGGFKQIMLSAAEIQAAHTEHALRNGLKMAQDKIVVMTRE